MGCSVKLGWLNCGIVWVQLGWLEPIRHKRGLLGGCDAHTSGETPVVRLHDAIEVVSVEEIRLLSCLLLFAFMS
jgi:hypothetical protein